MTNNKLENVVNDLGCHIANLEGVHALKEDVLEQYTAYGIGRSSKELQSANLKFVVLVDYLGRVIEDFNKSLDELHQVNKGEEDGK